MVVLHLFVCSERRGVIVQFSDCAASLCICSEVVLLL